MNDLPLIPLQGLVLFPGMIAPAVISRPEAMLAVAEHLERDVPVVFVAQRNPQGCVDCPADLHQVGCVGTILRTLRTGDGRTRILVEGLERVTISDVRPTPAGGLNADVEPLRDTGDPVRIDLLGGRLRQTLEALLGEDERRPSELGRAPDIAEGPERLCDYASGLLQLPTYLQQALLEEPDLSLRLELLAVEAAKALALMEINNRIEARVHEAVDTQQRRAFLEEQIRVCQEELGETGSLGDLDRLQRRLIASGMPQDPLDEALREIDRLRGISTDAAEYSVGRTWLELMADLPWNITTVDDHDLHRAREVLDTDHSGLDEVKERILDYLAVRQLNPDLKGLVLCFVGPPGVGKTSLVQSIAQALGRSWQRVALGGVKDEAEIRGHRRTYVGALPGRIIQAIRRSGTRNPVLLLDELDKLGAGGSDPSSALLEVLDPQQNQSYVDHYLDQPFDLSQVLFIATANVEHALPPALRDRLEVVRLRGYVEDEKVQIAKKHVLPRILRSHGLSSRQVRVSEPALREIIRGYTQEAGIRDLERQLTRLHRRVARRVVEGRKRALVVRPKDVSGLLGHPTVPTPASHAADRPGVALALAWTEVGGRVLVIEAASFAEGTGRLQLTGTMGEVMRESVEAALSLLRMEASGLGLSPTDFTERDHHVHVPMASIPKDGPSAGLVMLVALASRLTERKVREGLAFTGEISLRGRILGVGGVREKVLAAKREGLTTVILPRDNVSELEGLPASALEGLEIIGASEVKEVLAIALES